KGFVKDGFIVDLSTTKDTSQLVLELSSVMEHPDVREKKICLKLGDIDLSQSQLLSIKALIESMDAQIAFIDTKSEQTEAAATSLGIEKSSCIDNVEEVATYKAKEVEPEVVSEDAILDEIENSDATEDAEEVKTVEVHADIPAAEDVVKTLDGVEDIYTEQSTQVVSEIIPSEHFETNFQSLALDEGLVTPEEVSKYILLDTGDVLPEGAVENTTDTKTLPTLYLSQNLRSGQTVNYEGNVLILGDAHPGSEIVADGDITVWGILGGIAHAGARGNITAKVRALKLNAIQLRIAGLYARRNDTLNVPYVQKSNEFTPEEAQIEDGRIVIYKKLRRD
ncbi:MAG: hypothetical protein MJ231_04695, partial [bacterium]|nr:hypothetical protein [bacterium]